MVLKQHWSPCKTNSYGRKEGRQGDRTLLVFLDPSAVFDIAHHGILLGRLTSLGIGVPFSGGSVVFLIANPKWYNLGMLSLPLGTSVMGFHRD